ncbi:MAG: hypothetical protein HYX78_13040 [Armatimonadetes bacterium]|nr:hypothetical protein [Armatimonadota bacterium]
MKEQLKALCNLQQVDLQIAAARRAIAALNDGAALHKQLAAADRQLASLSEELRKSEAELHDNELNLKSIETKIQGFRNRLYAGSVTSPKELSSIEKEIEMLGKSRAKLDERILELYDLVERQQNAVKTLETKANDIRERHSKHTADYQAKSRDLNSQIEQLDTQRQKALETVTNRPLLQRYESLRGRYHDTGLARVTDGKCGGCHIGLTGFSLRKLKEGQEVQACESCGRILYLQENAS